MRNFAELFSTANTTALVQIFCRHEHEDAHLGIRDVFQLPPFHYLSKLLAQFGKPLVYTDSVLCIGSFCIWRITCCQLCAFYPLSSDASKLTCDRRRFERRTSWKAHEKELNSFYRVIIHIYIYIYRWSGEPWRPSIFSIPSVLRKLSL